MNVYSILAHPNQQSLNARLFNQANNHFSLLGYTVDQIDLYKNLSSILESNSLIYENKIPLEERRYSSPLNSNYNKGVLVASEFARDQITKIKNADLLFIQTPVLVWTLPAILKFYMEIVFLPEQMFTVNRPWADNFELIKFMSGKKVFFSFTLGSGQPMTNSVTGSTENLINPIKSMFEFVGYEWITPHITWGTMESQEKNNAYFSSFDTSLINTFAAPTIS
jgi:putative NADPH-quinone reductase